jgi:endonuclease YncB( thermonuclease family)
MHPYQCLTFITILIFSLHSHAGDDEQIRGTVVGISDGDTLTILTDDKKSLRIRLSEIDAPEKKQAFGEQSKLQLAALCFQKNAILKQTSLDRYQRTLARVICDGVDANQAMVAGGYAWVYDRYVKDKSLYKWQRKAQQEKRGLWIDPSPIAPWAFRRK